MASQSAGSGDANLVEVKGRTVDEAVARGLVRLGGVGRSDVHIEVVSTGKSGVLGFGHEEALVRMRLLDPGEKAAAAAAASAKGADAPKTKAPTARRSKASEPEAAAADDARSEPSAATLSESVEKAEKAEKPSSSRTRAPRAAATAESAEAPSAPEGPRAGTAEDEAIARDIVAEIMTGLGFHDVEIERMPTLLPEDLAGGEEPLILAVQAQGVERLLVSEAAPLQALQLLVRLIMNRRAQHWISVMLEVNGDRARRMRELCQLAEQSASLVEREGRPVSLPPMSAYERRVVHLALQEHPLVATQSIGSGDYRKVTVRRKDQLLPELN